MQKTITFRDPAVWVHNNGFGSTQPKGASYSDLFDRYNVKGTRIAMTGMIAVPGDGDFTISVAEGFQVAAVGFDEEQLYLGRTNGYDHLLPWTGGEEGAVVDIHTSAAYIVPVLRRSSGALLASDVAEASLAITYEDENTFGGGVVL